MTKLEQAKLFLDFYFAPWGAAKGEVWEDITYDQPFTNEVAMRFLERIVTGERILTEEDVKLMKIVTG